jgi:hypothetical protein
MADTFTAQVDDWVKKAKGAIDANVRSITIALFKGIILSTPVDTGRARGNWQTTIGAPASGTVEGADPSGAAAIGAVFANQGGAGKITWLANNLPYIQVLEYGLYPNPPKLGTRVKGGGYQILSVGGYSRQAPAGMVRVNMARIGEIVRNAKV